LLLFLSLFFPALNLLALVFFLLGSEVGWITHWFSGSVREATVNHCISGVLGLLMTGGSVLSLECKYLYILAFKDVFGSEPFTVWIRAEGISTTNNIME